MCSSSLRENHAEAGEAVLRRLTGLVSFTCVVSDGVPGGYLRGRLRATRTVANPRVPRELNITRAKNTTVVGRLGRLANAVFGMLVVGDPTTACTELSGACDCPGTCDCAGACDCSGLGVGVGVGVAALTWQRPNPAEA